MCSNTTSGLRNFLRTFVRTSSGRMARCANGMSWPLTFSSSGMQPHPPIKTLLANPFNGLLLRVHSSPTSLQRAAACLLRSQDERAIVAARDTDLDEVENSLKEGISLMLEKISNVEKELTQTQSDEMILQSSLQKRKMELEREEERLATFMNVRPAYMDEYEVLQKELQGLFSVYVERFRNLQWLEAQLEGFHAAEQQKHEEVQHKMKSLQRRFHEEELKFLQGVDMVSLSIENDQGSELGDCEHRTADFDKCFPVSQTWGNFQTLNSMKTDAAMDSISSGTPSVDQDGDDNDSDNLF